MEHIYRRRVHFADTDAAGVVHFARLLCYAEEAEHDLLAKLNIPILNNGGWPRVNVSCDYFAPIRFSRSRASDAPSDAAGLAGPSEVEVSIRAVEIGKSSVLWAFKISCCDGAGPEKHKLCAEGQVKTVRVNAEGKPETIAQQWRADLLSLA